MRKKSAISKMIAVSAAAATGVLVLGGASPASADAKSPGANGGGFLSGDTPRSPEQLAAAVEKKAEEVHVNTPANKLCTGLWKHKVSNVSFQRAKGGTLAWGFKLTHTARANLGPTVNVSMPYAYINGKSINPPYSPHTAHSGYNFHGSMRKYQKTGGGSGVLKTGNKVTLYWLLKGSRPDTAADRYITCKVPKPGSA